ncbi:MAG TPA: dTDP-4-dehydrorhamnose reductase [Syntrophorhabdales bacterium]|nr:dTDP-4-dehydrorhamnose reductase [Syntrophorhabdales bacterium]
MKILLIGKTGQLGSDLLRNNPGHEIYAPAEDVFDITVREAIDREIGGFKPDVVINTAAFHDLPRCETEPEQAFRVNCVAVRNLALACKEIGALFVTFSTDYVFGGEKRRPYLEDDRPSPLQMYGISKLAGEHAACAAAPEHTVIVRTCGLYGRQGTWGKGGGNFVDKRIEDARSATRLEMGSDQVVAPTCTDDLSTAVFQLIEHQVLKAGIYHLVNEGECTWYEFTKAIYEMTGITVDVIPVDRKGLTGTMRRPLYSVLANTKAKEIGVILPRWQDALARYLRSRPNRV